MAVILAKLTWEPGHHTLVVSRRLQPKQLHDLCFPFATVSVRSRSAAGHGEGACARHVLRRATN